MAKKNIETGELEPDLNPETEPDLTVSEEEAFKPILNNYEPEEVETEFTKALKEFKAGKLPKILPYTGQTFKLEKKDGKIGYYAKDGEVAYEADNEANLKQAIASFRPLI